MTANFALDSNQLSCYYNKYRQVKCILAVGGVWGNQAERAVITIADPTNLIWIMPAQGNGVIWKL